jgi:CO/xanthine dehydrogenase FAD-binding subunit
MTRHVDVEKSEFIKEKCPLLTEGIRWVGYTQIRSRRTIGGSIAHADPSAELP